MSDIIEIKGLTKRYGSLVALNELDLNVAEGAVVGFIGPNGAGKTTTMRILTTLLRPTGGQAFVAGHSVTKDPQSVRRVIGYMPDFFGVYDDMKVWEYLDFFAACYDIHPNTRGGMINDLLALVDLNHKKDDYVESLSRGMKQRLCLARTLAHDPQVLILDEPASGLDPRARIEMRELLRELKHMGKTIFFSSHILSEVADICTSIAVLEAGNLITYGNIEDMKRKLRPHRMIEIRIVGEAADMELLKSVLFDHEHVSEIFTATDAGELPPDTLRYAFMGTDAELTRLLGSLVQQNIPIVSFREETGDLEDVFLQVTKGVIN